MKSSLLAIFLLAIAATAANSKVVIHGKILHYDGKTIVYYHPTIEGIHVPYWLEIKPSAAGSFRIEFDNDGFGTTTIGFDSHVYRFFHDENSRIEITIDQQRMHKKHRVPHGEFHYDSS